jgi:hypothetical protein
MFSSDTKKMLENLGNVVPREDILQLLEKAKIDRKEQIDKWTNEYEGIKIYSYNRFVCGNTT